MICDSDMLLNQHKTLRLHLTLAFALLPLLSHAGLALDYYPQTGWSPTVEDWAQAVLNSNNIVEVRSSSTVPDAFTVTRSLYGPLKKGANLPFEQCRSLEMDVAPTETLRDMLRAPVVEGLATDNTLPVSDVNALARYPIPSRVARYILTIGRASHEGRLFWFFPIQTVGGDMLLIQSNRVYISVPVADWTQEKHDPRLRRVWVPHPFTPRAKDFELALLDEIAIKNEFLRISRLDDKQARIKGLHRYVDPTVVKKRRFAYSYRAIKLIAASGAIGTAYLREHAATPPLASYLSFILDQQNQQRDRAALPWLRKNFERSLDNSPSLPWPKRKCDPDSDASRESIVFLCQGAETLATLGDDRAVPLIRASIAWQLAQGRKWWNGTFPFTLNEQRITHPFTSKPVPESDPLIVMSRAIMDDPLFRPYPPLTAERTAQLRQTLRHWVQQYRHEAIPGLLWVWAQDDDPDVRRVHRGVRPELAHEALKELLGQDLGTAAMPYWNWYLKHVLKAQIS